MTLAVDIIKHGGKRPNEQFMREKLHASIVASCLATRTPEGFGQEIADKVCDLVSEWLDDRSIVTTIDIRNVTTRHFKPIHPEAAYIYEQNKIII